MPRPRKLKLASTRIACARLTLVITMIGAIPFGRMCRIRMRPFPMPIVRASVGVGFIIMAEATLSFLGIGVQEPRPSWGGMIRDGIVSLRTEPYLALSASTALGLTIIGFNLFGDGLRDILDPRIKDR